MLRIARRSTFRAGIYTLMAGIAVLLPFQGRAFEKTATTAATFLQIANGGRLSAMGGAGVALPGGPDLLATNPAATFTPDGLAVSVSHLDWFAGLNHESAALVLPTGPNFAVGLHAISFSGDSFEQTTLAAQEGNGIQVDYGDVAVGVSGIGRLTDRFTVGLTGKYIRQALFNETASTFAFDVGTLLKTTLNGFTIGMSMTNLGGEMQLDGRDLFVDPGGVSGGGTKLETSAWPLPLTFRTGVAWRLLGSEYAWRTNAANSVIVAADAKHLNEGVTTVHLGAEYGFNDTVFLRGGRTIGDDSETWAFGAGVKVDLYGYAVRADFGYADLGDLDAVQRITLTLLRK